MTRKQRRLTLIECAMTVLVVAESEISGHAEIVKSAPTSRQVRLAVVPSVGKTTVQGRRLAVQRSDGAPTAA
jgi:methionine-rich copper-binding protein CopC